MFDWWHVNHNHDTGCCILLLVPKGDISLSLKSAEPFTCHICGRLYGTGTEKKVIEAHYINKHKKWYLEELKKVRGMMK